jgi:DNA-binding transcriptional MerR regulator
VARALAVDYAGQANGRVRDVPDPRTIRYYTTIGLIDRPAALRGRTALYGRRHLMQLVAIKRLQAEGLSLTQVQARLVGLTDAALTRLARLPDGFENVAPTAAEMPEAADDRRDGRFWGAAPTPVPPPSAVRSLTAVTLADGATLLLDTTRPLNEQDLSALRLAAAPLLLLLKDRRLLGPDEGPTFTPEESP